MPNFLVADGIESDWVRGFMGTPRDADTPLVRCEMITVKSTNGHLSGHLLFINETGSKVYVCGTKDKTGKVWPNFTAQVINEGEKEWRTIGKFENAEPSIEIAINEFSEEEIHIDMDLFRPSIGKVMYGRVLFNNGVWTMFDLELFNH